VYEIRWPKVGVVEQPGGGGAGGVFLGIAHLGPGGGSVGAVGKKGDGRAWGPHEVALTGDGGLGGVSRFLEKVIGGGGSEGGLIGTKGSLRGLASEEEFEGGVGLLFWPGRRWECGTPGEGAKVLMAGAEIRRGGDGTVGGSVGPFWPPWSSARWWNVV